MTPDERESLRRDLEAAGCEKLSRVVAWAHWHMPDADVFMTELRSLLRREERLRVMEAAVRAAEHLTFDLSDPLTLEMVTALGLLETEVPDGGI